MQLTLTLSKSTKGTHVYADPLPNAPIPTLYINRNALPAKPPVSITVVISHG